ncbi:sulfatase-like hydrolase/transferase [Permianibacter sp. IMCC34836]|uniref:sulfatase-like hydrolase/transferase n=1 Tax=Permianibacter fluminis TaxID=2738515 RepID=UPI00155268AB|nr:sulfatase-like hydrolase/transferase [Permianibacter fluminis]NQD37672.1 sulfatase-like hydrolase/transferase [Permianibacter fluminis]
MSTPLTDRLLPLRHYFLLLWLLNLLLTLPFLLSHASYTALSLGFALLIWLTYGFLYTLPALLPTWALGKLAGRRLGQTGMRILLALAALLGAGINIALFADFTIFKIFAFHLNGFVWNLMTTPGGITSMGADAATMYSFAALIALLLLGHQLLAWYLQRDNRFRRWLDGRFAGRYRRLLYVFAVLTLTERVSYAIAHVRGSSPVLSVANNFPFHNPTTATHLLKRFGINVKRQAEFKMDDHAALNYPKAPLQKVTPEKPLNIVWLVAESWRSDTLNAEIMPQMQAFADRAQLFTQHYSGSNGTRWGIFTQFYGLYGTYWFTVLENRRSPVLVDRLQELNYQLHISTSSAFSYPEFDQTVWVNVPAANMHLPEGEGPGWNFDRKGVDRIEHFLDTRPTDKPFFLFHFFESAHARYYFPDDSIIKKPYLEDLNYATMDLEKDIGLIKNRYLNSVHHLDSQLGRVIKDLEQRNLLDSTMIIITGDHGEEFMEKGHWGHNSQFHEEQTRVPLIVYLPGLAPERHDGLSSHLDIPATVLPQLGIKNDPRDYSFGCNLLSHCERKELVFGDWDRIGYVDSQYKLIFPLKSSGYTANAVTDRNDQPVADEDAIQAQYQPVMIRLMKEMTEFSQKR